MGSDASGSYGGKDLAGFVLAPERTSAESALDMESTIVDWVKAAMARAEVHDTDEDGGIATTVADVKGALGYGFTREEALDSLRLGLEAWARFKLEKGDEDIPTLGGVCVYPA